MTTETEESELLFCDSEKCKQSAQSVFGGENSWLPNRVSLHRGKKKKGATPRNKTTTNRFRVSNRKTSPPPPPSELSDTAVGGHSWRNCHLPKTETRIQDDQSG